MSSWRDAEEREFVNSGAADLAVDDRRERDAQSRGKIRAELRGAKAAASLALDLLEERPTDVLEKLSERLAALELTAARARSELEAVYRREGRL